MEKLLNLKFSDIKVDAPSFFGVAKRNTNFDARVAFEYVVPYVAQLATPVYSPLFSTANDQFWQLTFGPPSEAENSHFDLFLTAVPNGQESKIIGNWDHRGKLSARVYLKDYKTYEELAGREFRTNGYSIMGPMLGFKRFWRKEEVEGNKIIVGVEFKDTANALDSSSIQTLPWDPIPTDLTDAWAAHLENPKTADVQFVFDDRIIYGHTDILSKRSEHFRELFAAAPPAYDQIVSSQTPLAPPTAHQTIKITDFDYETFYGMIKFLYTDKVSFDQARALSLFEIADKYRIEELRARAKVEVCQTLTVNNAALILYGMAYKYPDLKEHVIKYVESNFDDIRETNQFKGIVAAPTLYPAFSQLTAEIYSVLGENAKPL